MRRPLIVAGLGVVSFLVLVFCFIAAIAVVDVFRYADVINAGDNGPAPAASNDPVQRGEAIYNQRCSGCHTIDGSARVGPSFKGLYGSEVQLEGGDTVVADEEYIRESIRDPSAKIVAGYPRVMPSFKNLSDGEVDDLIAFIRSLE